MKYQNAAFELAAGRVDQLPASALPEIVFSGKSNVGKSTLINNNSASTDIKIKIIVQLLQLLSCKEQSKSLKYH